MKKQMHKAKDDAPVIVQGLRKSFGKQIVLDGIDLTVEAGETVAVLGRSGTGKSVLLKLLIGLQKPDSGSIRILGQEIAGLEMDVLNDVRKKMGFLFQQSALYDSLNVEENVAFPLRRHTQLPDADRQKRCVSCFRASVWKGSAEDSFRPFRRNAEARSAGPRHRAGSGSFAVRRTDHGPRSDYGFRDREIDCRPAKDSTT